MEKYLLFYSNYCNYSKTLLDEVIKKDLQDYFLTVCVDTNIYTIPPFVDRVPIVYNKKSKKVFAEDSIIDLINEIHAYKNGANNNANNVNNNANNANNETKEEIESYSKIEMNNNFSDNFSFLDDNSQKRSFVFIENDKYNENVVLSSQPKSTTNDEGQSKLDSSSIEKYMMQRDADFNNAMKKMAQN